jgi:hypothetical protein
MSQLRADENPVDVLRKFHSHDVQSSTPYQTQHVVDRLILALATAVEDTIGPAEVYNGQLARSVRVSKGFMRGTGTDDTKGGQ